MTFSLDPDAKIRVPSGCHTSPSHVCSTSIRLMTCMVLVSKMLSAGVAYPLVETARNRPSGDATRFIGRSPTVRCRPSGAMRQPLGRSVTPSPLYPGQTGGDGPRWASGVNDAAATINPNPASAAYRRIACSPHAKPGGLIRPVPAAELYPKNRSSGAAIAQGANRPRAAYPEPVSAL